MPFDIRLQTQNMSGRDFDNLIDDLKRTQNQISKTDTDIQNVFISLSSSITDAFGLVVQSFFESTIQIEGYHDSLISSVEDADTSFESLRDIIQLPAVPSNTTTEGLNRRLNTVVFEADLANRSITEFRNAMELIGSTDLSADLFDGANPRIEKGTIKPDERFVGAGFPRPMLVDLRSELLDSKEVFRNIQDISELDRVTQSYVSTLDAVNQISREEIATQLALENAALTRLSNQEQAESQHAKTIEEIIIQIRQLELESERERTQLKREEVNKRKTEDVVSGQSLNQGQDFISLTGSMAESVQRLQTSISIFSELFKREFTTALQSGVAVLDDVRHNLREPLMSIFSEDMRGLDALSRLEQDRSKYNTRRDGGSPSVVTSTEAFTEQDRSDTDKAQRRDRVSPSVVTSLPSQQAFNRDQLIERTGNLIGNVPLDVVDVVTNIVQVRRDANAELIILEQESAAEIQIIQESVTLSAENKVKAIERIEREAALKRIRIENAVSQRQRASFQSVVTNFVSGVGQMIAAEAQLALARRATSAISGLFGGAGAGAGLLSGVALPLVGGLALAYGATQLISPSSPSADVYESSQYAGDAAARNVQQTPGLTRAEQESVSPVLEANINVNVEASGTRLGQANERVKLKTERWGG